MASLLNRVEKWGFVHIAKTGGTSLEYLLKDIPNTQVLNFHAPLKDLNDVKDYFIFTIVRNPFEQIMSGYFHMLEEIKKPNKNNPMFASVHKEYDPLTFSKFIELVEAEIIFLTHTQTWHIVDRSSKDKKVSFIGRYENFAEDCKIVFNTIKVKNQIKHHNKNSILLKENETKSQFYRKQYTEQWMIDWVLNKYREDFENFGYSKKL